MGCLSYHLGYPVEAGDVARSLMKVLLRLAGHLYVDKYVSTTAFSICSHCTSLLFDSIYRLLLPFPRFPFFESYFLFFIHSSIYLNHSDRGFLIRLECSKDGERGKDKDKEKEKDKDKDKDKDKEKDSNNPSVSYSHSALPVSSEAISLFRFLLRIEDWRAVVEQTLLRPLVDMTERIRTFQVSTYVSVTPIL